MSAAAAITTRLAATKVMAAVALLIPMPLPATDSSIYVGAVVIHPHPGAQLCAIKES